MCKLGMETRKKERTATRWNSFVYGTNRQVEAEEEEQDEDDDEGGAERALSGCRWEGGARGGGLRKRSRPTAHSSARLKDEVEAEGTGRMQMETSTDALLYVS